MHRIKTSNSFAVVFLVLLSLARRCRDRGLEFTEALATELLSSMTPNATADRPSCTLQVLAAQTSVDPCLIPVELMVASAGTIKFCMLDLAG